jgi:Domain of unknown function (DUF4149)
MANTYSISKDRQPWLTALAAVVGFWLSATVLLDFTIMPSMYFSGMMNTPNFGAVGYMLFSMFNRIELLCAGVALSAGLWFLASSRYSERQKIEVGFSAVMLLAIALCYTFILTPQMGGLSVDLHSIDGLSALNGGLEDLQMHSTLSTVPAGMNQMHVIYWVLEAVKITALASLLGFAYRQLVGAES